MIVHSSIPSGGRVSLIADLNPDSVTFPLNLPLPQAPVEAYVWSEPGWWPDRDYHVNQFSSARTGAELGKKFETFPCSNSCVIIVFPCLEIPD